MVSSSELICDFVNTLHKDPSGDEEDLSSPAALGQWLSAHELLEGAGASPGDLLRAIDLREALRVLLLENNDVEVDTARAWAVLDEAARRGRVQLRFPAGAPGLLPAAQGVAGALGRIVAAVHAAAADGSWRRLKACRAEDCEWAFVDKARNQSRAWCSMRSCGNREKARVYRRRHASETGSRRAV
jgi:predicted RNA-binding Zn ribbon-like protein